MSMSFNEEGVQVAWNASSIKLAETCLRKYQYAMIEGWRPVNESVHLKFGGLYAAALEQFYKHSAAGMPWEEAIAAVVTTALIETWDHELDEEGNRIAGTGTAWESHHNTKTRETLIRSIIWYLGTYREQVYTPLILGDGAPAVELSFTFEVENGVIFAGHLDAIMTDGTDNYVVDQKTTGGTLTPYYFDQFKPDTQMSMYTLAGNVVFKTPISGVIVDAAQIAVGFTRFARAATFRTDDEISEWYDGAMYHIHAAQEAARTGFFPMNTASCGNYGGCQFRRICSRGPLTRPQFLKADFVSGQRFDPLERR